MKRKAIALLVTVPARFTIPQATDVAAQLAHALEAVETVAGDGPAVHHRVDEVRVEEEWATADEDDDEP